MDKPLKIIENIENKIELQEWFMNHMPSDEMLWKQAAVNQIMFIRDKISWLVQEKREEVQVISTHISKSIELPVYYLKRDNLHIILRDNM